MRSVAAPARSRPLAHEGFTRAAGSTPAGQGVDPRAWRKLREGEPSTTATLGGSHGSNRSRSPSEGRASSLDPLGARWATVAHVRLTAFLRHRGCDANHRHYTAFAGLAAPSPVRPVISHRPREAMRPAHHETAGGSRSVSSVRRLDSVPSPRRRKRRLGHLQDRHGRRTQATRKVDLHVHDSRPSSHLSRGFASPGVPPQGRRERSLRPRGRRAVVGGVHERRVALPADDAAGGA